VRLRVLHVAQPTDAGVARCAADLAADQRDRGWDVTVAAPAAGPLGVWLAASGVAHVPWEATRSPGPSVLRETAALHHIVRRVDPQLVHLHSSKAGLAGRLAVHGTRPTVFQPHAWSFDAVGGPVRRASLAWEVVAARWSARVLCVSEAERERGVAAGIHAEWAVIPNGVDLDRFPAATAAERARARIELDLTGPAVVCVGRLARQKGQDLLLDAWPAVRAAVPGAQLHLVGDGPDAAALAGRRVEGVRLHGRRDDVGRWLAAADVAAFPSRWEGMSLAVLEALARGCSVVAADVTGVRESLPVGTGGLVPPEDPAALGAALVARLRDPTLVEAEREVARAHVARSHDLRETCRRTADLYRSVLAL
jgi:glycosyltransferase involved in cell wall biosynthesis